MRVKIVKDSGRFDVESSKFNLKMTSYKKENAPAQVFLLIVHVISYLYAAEYLEMSNAYSTYLVTLHV